MDRVRLLNLPSRRSAGQVRKFVAATLELPADAVVCNKAPRWTHAFLSFRPTGKQPDIPCLESLKDRLAKVHWKNNKLDARLEKDVPRSGPIVDLSRVERNLQDQVTPLWGMPYAEQLLFKQNKLVTLLRERRLGSEEGWEMESIKASPTTYGYRNKCEFSIALNRAGVPTVGFLLGAFKEGLVVVENARDCVHVPDELKDLADHLQEFVRSSGVAPYDRRMKEGFWRLMLARIHDGKIMTAIQVNSKSLPEGKPASLLKDQLVEHMRAFPRGIDSFFLQDTDAVHNGIDTKVSVELIFGADHLLATQCGLRFRISPLSFFQVNPTATEVLYDTIKEYVRDSLSPETVLLDLCCGTGTIGMILAPFVQRVIGVELVPDAIADAKINAALNNITNIEFECNRAETAIGKVISSVPLSQPIVVVLDPPRSGAHPSVIKAILGCERICRVVYVACNPEAAAPSFAQLTQPKSGASHSSCFKLTRAVGVDLFPMTEHCELVLQFNRSISS